MDIRVSGHQIETGIALQEHVADRLDGIVDKYFDRAISSHVTFGKAPAGAFVCDIVMHVMQGLILKSHAEAHDAHQSFEAAAEKIEKQLRRYKRRLKDRHEQTAHAMREDECEVSPGIGRGVFFIGLDRLRRSQSSGSRRLSEQLEEALGEAQENRAGRGL